MICKMILLFFIIGYKLWAKHEDKINKESFKYPGRSGYVTIFTYIDPLFTVAYYQELQLKLNYSN